MKRPAGRGRKRWLGVAVLSLFACFALGTAAQDQGGDLRPEVRAFVAELVARHGFEPEELENTLSRARVQGAIIRAISTPGTARPWHEFRADFVNAQRIGAGLGFWDDNADTLARARAEYGVPEEIIVAVIGVETLYGRRVGSHRVLDALYTLAFDYPPRADFFRDELEQYLLFARESGADPLRLKGSYAGAMGIPQFMPSSARRYAVDFDRDGTLDLWGNAADSIGSVANYLQIFGWRQGEPVMVRAQVTGEEYAGLLQEGIKPQRTVEEMGTLGVTPAEPVPTDLRAALFRLEGVGGPEYWLGFENFYAVTRYNRSLNYATAVYQLAEEIKALRHATVAPTPAAEPEPGVRRGPWADSKIGD